MERSQQQLIDRCQNGELENFGGLYDAYVKQIYDFIFYRAKRPRTSSLYQSLERINSFSPAKGTYSAWLYQIARNTLIDGYKQNRPLDPAEALENFASKENLENQTNAKLNLEKVQKFLTSLDEEKREIITMRVWDGLSYKEIADVLGKSEASCKMTFSRTIEKLNKEVAFALIYLLIMKAS
jgi:RNA polymerase sigma-70 factor (ECF subfamily)